MKVTNINVYNDAFCKACYKGLEVIRQFVKENGGFYMFDKSTGFPYVITEEWDFDTNVSTFTEAVAYALKVDKNDDLWAFLSPHMATYFTEYTKEEILADKDDNWCYVEWDSGVVLPDFVNKLLGHLEYCLS